MIVYFSRLAARACNAGVRRVRGLAMQSRIIQPPSHHAPPIIPISSRALFLVSAVIRTTTRPEPGWPYSTVAPSGACTHTGSTNKSSSPSTSTLTGPGKSRALRTADSASSVILPAGLLQRNSALTEVLSGSVRLARFSMPSTTWTCGTMPHCNNLQVVASPTAIKTESRAISSNAAHDTSASGTSFPRGLRKASRIPSASFTAYLQRTRAGGLHRRLCILFRFVIGGSLVPKSGG